MSRQMHKLTALQVGRLKEPGRHGDGGGLYLSIGKDGRRRWIFIYRDRRTQKLREMGLGSAQDVPLQKARERAQAAREHLRDGRDPLAERKAQDDKPAPTFGELADEVISALESGWVNETHRKQWRATLKLHAGKLGSMRVDEIKTEDVLAVLKPIWERRHQTAKRVRGRIEKILDAAKAKGHRTGENPAIWRGNLDHLLSAPKTPVRRHPAMPIDEVPAFVVKLRAADSIAARALEFAILTCARSGEAIGARWNEIDAKTNVWTIPGFDPATGSRMKAKKDHRVPLSVRALEILKEMKAAQVGPYVFPGRKPGEPLSSDVFRAVMRWLEALPNTPHGFRSSFRDWVGERTSYPPELAEHALAHRVGDAVELAYRRGDALERRRTMMEAWGRFLEGETSNNVVPLTRAVGT